MAELSAHAPLPRTKGSGRAGRVGRAGKSPRKESKREAQQATEAGLDLLRVLGWLVLHDVTLPGAGEPDAEERSIDHVLAGPSGVYVVNTVGWSGAIDAKEHALVVGGVDRADAVAEVSAAADAVRGVLHGIPVAPMLCFERLEPVTGVAAAVALCASENILDLLTSQPPIVDQAAVAKASGMLGLACRPSSRTPGMTQPPPPRAGDPAKNGATNGHAHFGAAGAPVAGSSEGTVATPDPVEPPTTRPSLKVVASAEDIARVAAFERLMDGTGGASPEHEAPTTIDTTVAVAAVTDASVADPEPVDVEAAVLEAELWEREVAEADDQERAAREQQERALREATTRAAEEDRERETAEREAKEARDRKAREARERVEREAVRLAEDEARELAEREAQEREQAEDEARERAAQDAREAAEQEARELGAWEARESAVREALERDRVEAQERERDRIETQERERSEREVRELAEWEARERAVREALERDRDEAQERERDRIEALERAEQEAREAAEREARELAEAAERERAEAAERERAEQEAREAAEREARELAEAAERERAEQEAREAAEREARELAETAERERAEAAERERAEQEAREAAEREARELAETAERERAEQEARDAAEREAQERELAAAEARLRAEQDEQELVAHEDEHDAEPAELTAADEDEVQARADRVAAIREREAQRARERAEAEAAAQAAAARRQAAAEAPDRREPSRAEVRRARTSVSTPPAVVASAAAPDDTIDRPTRARSLLRLTIAALVMAAVILGAPRVPDAVSSVRGMFVDSTTHVGTAVSVKATDTHPDVTLLAGSPVNARATGGFRAAKGQHLVAVPLRLTNGGLVRWDPAIGASTTAVDDRGTTVAAATDVPGLKGLTLLPGQAKVAPGEAVTGYVVFPVTDGHTLETVSFGLAGPTGDVVTWQVAP